MIRLAVTLILTALVLLPVPVRAAETGAGTIEVTVVNGTKGGTPVTGQEFTYRVLENGTETGSKPVRTDDKGKFKVDGLSTSDSKREFQVAINFQEADYESEKVTFDKSATGKSITMTVYDATDSDKSISVSVQHVIVYPEEKGLLIKEYAMFNNVSNLTFTGSGEVTPGKKGTLKFFIPPEASELEYGLSLMTCCVYPGDDSFSDTMAFIPGAKETVYSYTIPYSADKLTLTERFNYPTDAFNLLIAAGDINISGGNLNPQPPVTIEGKQFSRFTLENLAPGEAIQVDLSGLPRPSGGASRWLLLSAASAVAGVAGYLVIRRRSPKAEPVAVSTRAAASPANLLQQKQRLVNEIARLDDSFDAGGLDDALYQKERAAKKARLMRLMQQIKDSGGGRS